MKYFFLLVLVVLETTSINAQNGWPNEITPKVLQNIKDDIEKKIPALKGSYLAKEYTSDEIEFSLDTFRFTQVVKKRMEVDYSTAGMNQTVIEMTKSYDILMNKYYNKLLNRLRLEDKKILIVTQRAWIKFRDAEFKLIGVLLNDNYTGGGTIHSSIAISRYSDIIVNRTMEIFNYYNEIQKE